jgi:6-phosphofructokinase 1
MGFFMKKIGVLTSGGDSPGMNAVIRAVTRTAIDRGYEVIGIRHGFNGLINVGGKETREQMDAKLIPLNVRTVSDIIQKGGTVLYTARCLEFKEEKYIKQAIERCKELELVGVVVIGGDGSFRGARDFSNGKICRDGEKIENSALEGIPCIGIPGTIDNDIACTDYTVGYDTAMNTAMEMVDKLRDTAQSHDRCSVVEVMGRHAGWIALNVGIAVGAMAIVTEEMPYQIDNIVAKIKKSQENNKKHFVIVVSEGIGDPQRFAQEIEQLTGIEARATVLGHVQRGGSPTVRDRVVASEMGYYAVELIHKGIGNRIVALKGNDVVDYDINEALAMKKPFNERLYNIANIISK